ncbi:MAG: TRZ/ATZ family hydrolase, partial [Gammaproteobacteria bacterium]|nr:TRZ/ATZ family hydrolase [Gammaproteobacteria bacterium]
THAAMSLFRGLADDLPLMEWLNEHIWPAEGRWVNEEFVADGTRLAVAEMIASGTTCFNDMYFFPDQTADVAIEAGIRACVGLILIDFPTAWAKDAQEYINKGEAVHDKYRHAPLIRTAFAPHAPYTVSDEPLQRIRVLAEELDVPIHMHLHETGDEIGQSNEIFRKRPIERLRDLDLLGQRLLAVHMTQLEDSDIELAARFNINVVHCPESNLKLASGFCPVQKLSDAGVNLCIGTDGAASNNNLDMLGEINTAALLAKGVAGNSTAVPAMTALRMATIQAARALAMDDLTGSLEAGKQADIVAVNLESVNTQPVYDPVSHIVYAAGHEQVTHVWVAGKQLLDNRKLITLNRDGLLDKARYWAERIRAGEHTAS